MYTAKDYPARLQLPPQNDASVAPGLRMTAHGVALAATLFFCWFYACLISNRFGDEALRAVQHQDLYVLTDARADFDTQIFFLPVTGFLGYCAIRLVIGGSRWLWKIAKRKH
jgi:hypothetical protein